MDIKPSTILIVEDEKPLIKALAQKLGEEGYNILQAGDGEEALEVGFEKQPDLILLDIKMPNMDGVRFMQELRDRGGNWAKNVKVIILTNYNPDNEIIEGLKGTDPTYYLLKADMTISDIQAKVAEVLKGEAI